MPRAATNSPIAWLAPLLLAACGAPPLHDTTPLRFEACGDGLECARTRVPLDWSCANDACSTGAVSMLVRRARVPRGEPNGQLWALDGGPGFSGDGFFDPAFVELIHTMGYDLYVPTHRGAHGSSVLSCPDAESAGSPGGPQVTIEEMPACKASLEATWGDLAHFSSTAAGQDVADLIARAPATDSVVLYGGSYGTLWAQRILQAKPDAADLVWLDSVVDLEATLDNADQHADRAARALFEQCERSGSCPIDEAGALEVLQAHDAGEGCGETDGNELRALGYRLLNGRVQERLVYALILAAAERCQPEDRTALQHALNRLREPPSVSAPPLAYAPLLNVHIVASEFDGGRPPSLPDTLLASPGRDALIRRRNDAWNALRHVGPAHTETDARVVLWSGRLDPLDPPAWAERVAERWSAELVLVEDAAHSVIRYLNTPDGNCGHTNLIALGADPTAPIMRDCLSAIETVDWTQSQPETRELVESWLGPAP